MARSQSHALDRHDLVHWEPHEKTVLERALDLVERVGNKVPHPVVIFVLLIGLVILLSHLFYLMGASVTYEAINTGDRRGRRRHDLGPQPADGGRHPLHVHRASFRTS